MEKSIKLNKNNSYYVFPLQVCKMINNITIPSKNAGEFVFKDFRDDELRMSEVFEKFVRNFYATEQKIHKELMRLIFSLIKNLKDNVFFI